MADRSGEALGAEAPRRLATLGRAELHSPLTDAEITGVQDSFAFEFADDHRAFLAAGLPLGEGWPDWRHGSAEQLRDALTSPATGVLFDVEHNAFWDHRWGEPPADIGERMQLAGDKLADVPHMVPVYAHRYLPAGRETFGHPVLSIHQTDIICYGTNLVDYVYQEFGAGAGYQRDDPRWRPRPTVAFWSELID